MVAQQRNDPPPPSTMLSYDEKSVRIDTGTPTTNKKQSQLGIMLGIMLGIFLPPFPQNNVGYLLSFRKLKKKSSKSRHRTRAWHKRPPNWDFEKLGRRPKETPIFEKSFVIF